MTTTKRQLSMEEALAFQGLPSDRRHRDGCPFFGKTPAGRKSRGARVEVTYCGLCQNPLAYICKSCFTSTPIYPHTVWDCTDPMTPRPQVLAFARLMEERLRANDHKGGWEECSYEYLLNRMAEERQELRELFPDVFARQDEPPARHHSPVMVGRESADVANFALMVADNAGALPERLHKATAHGAPCLVCGQVPVIVDGDLVFPTPSCSGAKRQPRVAR